MHPSSLPLAGLLAHSVRGADWLTAVHVRSQCRTPPAKWIRPSMARNRTPTPTDHRGLGERATVHPPMLPICAPDSPHTMVPHALIPKLSIIARIRFSATTTLRRTTAPRFSRTVSAPPLRVAPHPRAHPSSWTRAPPRIKWYGASPFTLLCISDLTWHHLSPTLLRAPLPPLLRRRHLHHHMLEAPVPCQRRWKACFGPP
ncbi:hypothetical protein C8R44DRAFT_895175 [Mycena epipterygia]|nr:hypothetical protein C8R44DRAFT_895175 [Mycena epipterygia]